MRAIWRWSCRSAIVVVALLATASPAAAHSSLVSSDPVADSVLDDSPGEIRLTFSEAVDVGDGAIRLLAADGDAVLVGPVNQDAGPDSITARIAEPLAPGSYVVAWTAVSGDSHPIRGAFVFSVGEVSADAEQLIDELGGTVATGPDGNGWLGVGRFASYAGIAALVGTMAMAAVLAPTTLRERRLGYVLFAAGHLALAGSIVMTSAQANVIGTSLADWPQVAATRSGRWWLARLMIVAAAVMLIPWRAMFERRGPRLVGAIAAVGLFAVVAAGGHAVTGRAATVGFAATVVHLAAMALWVGGLCLVALVVGRDQLAQCAARVSPVALGAVVALALSGVVNGWRQLDRPAAILESSYGRWLVVKLVLIAVVVAVAVVSRRLARQVPADTEAMPRARRLRRAVGVEVAGVAMVVAATAGLTGATPPTAGAVFVGDVSVSATRNGYVAQIVVTPAVTGGTTMHVIITPPADRPAPADEIDVTIAMPERQLGPLEVATFPAGPNHVTTNDANFPLAGRWAITVTARYGPFDQLVFTADADIAQP